MTQLGRTCLRRRCTTSKRERDIVSGLELWSLLKSRLARWVNRQLKDTGDPHLQHIPYFVTRGTLQRVIASPAIQTHDSRRGQNFPNPALNQTPLARLKRLADDSRRANHVRSQTAGLLCSAGRGWIVSGFPQDSCSRFSQRGLWTSVQDDDRQRALLKFHATSDPQESCMRRIRCGKIRATRQDTP